MTQKSDSAVIVSVGSRKFALDLSSVARVGLPQAWFDLPPLPKVPWSAFAYSDGKLVAVFFLPKENEDEESAIDSRLKWLVFLKPVERAVALGVDYVQVMPARRDSNADRYFLDSGECIPRIDVDLYVSLLNQEDHGSR
jgi:hypothetical protein